ncbi:SUMO-specific isopeptidase USPL1-like isoform X2 [Schistocerca gregaria]|nr:SUMO-specific isopeptidase USPL1-like isoform X2 [Schistocerca gregaria]
MMLAWCPLCLAKGRHSSLEYFRMSLKESALLCSNMRCPFPLGTDYDDVFIEHDSSDSEDYMSEGGESEDDAILKAFPLCSSSFADSKCSQKGTHLQSQ